MLGILIGIIIDYRDMSMVGIESQPRLGDGKLNPMRNKLN